MRLVCVFFSSAVPLLFAVIVSFLLVLLHFGGGGSFVFLRERGGEGVGFTTHAFFSFFPSDFRSFSLLWAAMTSVLGKDSDGCT